MAPSFFSKLVRAPNNSNNSHERSDSSPSPTPSTTGRRSFSAAFRGRSQSSAGGDTSGNATHNDEDIPPVPSISAQFASANSKDTDDTSASSAQHNVTVVPPSPSLGSTVEMNSNDYESSLFNRPIDGLPASSDGGAVALMSKHPVSETTISPPRPASAHSDRAPPSRPPSPPRPQSSSAATVGTSSPAMSFLLSPAPLRNSASNKSLNKAAAPTITTNGKRGSPRARSATTPPEMASMNASEPPAPVITESPTSELPPKSLGEATTVIPRSPSFSNLFASRDSDSASVMTSSKKKQKSPSGWKRQPTSKPTGLAGAIAASGLAMVNPGMVSPIHQLSPSATMPMQRSRSRANSINAPPSRSASPSTMSRKTGKKGHKKQAPSASGMSDVNSELNYDENGVLLTSTQGTLDYYSGLDDDDSSDEDSDDDSGDDALKDLDFGEDDIPVTGFAVASSRRNQEFHELFTTIPPEDYLIEDYGCALQREILLQGRLYISENHICFHANIFGWITDLSIPIHEITHLEKKMTAFVIPNAILITTRQNKYSFTSFLSRDTTYDVIYNIWRLVRPGNGDGSSFVSGRGSLDAGRSVDNIVEGTIIGPGGNGLMVSGSGKIKAKVTHCLCSTEGKHYSETVMDAVFPGTPDKIHALMFQSGFMKDFLSGDQKLLNLELSDWTPIQDGSTLLARNMSYIKPLSGSVGPKQTTCQIHDATDHADFEDYVSMITTTKNPDVPSGGVFSVKTRTCITWASAMSTRVVVTTQVEWTGRSFIKGIIERSALDGQRTYHADLEKAIRREIQEHQSEFLPEGVDVAMVTPAVEVSAADAELGSGQNANGSAMNGKQRERDRNQRSLQWAWDTFAGAKNVAVDSTKGALELVNDAWDQSSSITILHFIIVFLVISNIYTYTKMGSREEVGRKKEMQQRDKFVQGVVSALWDELSMHPPHEIPAPLVPPPLTPAAAPYGAAPTHGSGGEVSVDLELLVKTLEQAEERVAKLEKGLEELQLTVAKLNVTV